MKKIRLGGHRNRGQKHTLTWVLVDDEDYEILNITKWCQSNGGYAITHTWNGVKQKCQYMHRIIINAKKGEQVDHINGNKLDNRKSNLRLCTPGQNQHNQKLSKEHLSGVLQ